MEAQRLDNIKSNAMNSVSEPISKIKGDVMDSTSELASRIRSASTDIVRESVGYVKRYPLHTAVGALCVGFLAGMLARRK